jgi:hypothetical protein
MQVGGDHAKRINLGIIANEANEANEESGLSRAKQSSSKRMARIAHEEFCIIIAPLDRTVGERNLTRA